MVLQKDVSETCHVGRMSVAATSKAKEREMRKLALLFGLTLTLALTTSPAVAGGFDFDQTVTNATAGAEAVLTAPLAPFFGIVFGDPALDLPFAPVTDRLVGAFTGGAAGAFSLATGLIDIAFALPASLVGITPISPQPIINLW